MEKKKNLVVIHLESISNQVLNSYQPEMHFISRFMGECVSFRRFFSSATSTFMALSDLIRGENFNMDAGTYYHDFRVESYQDDLIAILARNGFVNTAAYLTCKGVTDEAWVKEVEKNSFATWPQKGIARRVIRNFEEMDAVLDESTAKEPFFLFLYDWYGHVMSILKEKEDAPDMQLHIAEGYRHVNQTTEFLLAYLQQKDLLKDTLIVAYGDHGDSLYSHGFQHGMCHGEPPYCPMCWTPCFIYDGKTSGIYDNVASLVDLRSTILPLLGLPEYRNFEWAGINLFGGLNEVVYSQNLYANQIETNALWDNCDWDKGFAVMNNLYNLVATRHGMELYAYNFDPANGCNLLHFFDLNSEGDITGFKPPETLARAGFIHFQRLFQPKYLQSIANNFQFLKAKLSERIQLKERLIETAKPQFYVKFDMSAFTRARKRDDYLW